MTTVLAAAAAPSGASPVRAVRFNGRALEAGERQTLERLERFIGRVPDGDYWYDPGTGASGGGTAWSKRHEGGSGGTKNLAGDGTTTCVSVSGYSRCTGE